MTDMVQARALAAMTERAEAAERDAAEAISLVAEAQARQEDAEREVIERLAEQGEHFHAAYSKAESRALAAEAEAERLREALRELLDSATPEFVAVMKSTMPDESVGRLFKARLAARAALSSPGDDHE